MQGFFFCTIFVKIKVTIMDKYKGYSVGDRIRITKKPTMWTSELNTNNPTSGAGKNKITFPIEITIKKLKDCERYVAMTCGNYGWDMKTLIDDNCIEKICSPVSDLKKFVAGDYIVSENSINNRRKEGEIFNVLSYYNSSGNLKDFLYYKKNVYAHESNFRIATPKEKNHFDKVGLGANIKDIVENTEGELKIGEYYYVWDTSSGFWMIGQHLENKENDSIRGVADLINFTSQLKLKQSWCLGGGGRQCRKATNQEKAWLNHCIKLGKYVSTRDFNNYVPIEGVPTPDSYKILSVSGDKVSYNGSIGESQSTEFGTYRDEAVMLTGEHMKENKREFEPQDAILIKKKKPRKFKLIIS